MRSALEELRALEPKLAMLVCSLDAAKEANADPRLPPAAERSILDRAADTFRVLCAQLADAESIIGDDVSLEDFAREGKLHRSLLVAIAALLSRVPVSRREEWQGVFDARRREPESHGERRG